MNRSTSRNGAVAALVAALLLLTALPAAAHHTTITNRDYNWNQLSPHEASNGKRVFLSAPRHSDSHTKPQCSNGWEENVNGRYHNTQAGGGVYYYEQVSDSPSRNIQGRGYNVMIGRNPRDNGIDAGAGENTYLSDNFGADVHHVVHSNGNTNPLCTSSSKQYWETFYSDRYGHNDDLAQWTYWAYKKADSMIPGPLYAPKHESLTKPKSLYEAGRPDAPHTAYMELSHHSSLAGQAFMKGDAKRIAWRLGWAIDKLLGYP
jgi:hypothetical protein